MSSKSVQQLKDWEAQGAALLKVPTFSDSLRPLVESLSDSRAKQEEFETEYPGLSKALHAKVAETRAAGIPKDPRLSEYEEGTVKYELMKNIFEGEYLKQACKDAGLGTYTLTAADKERLLAEMKSLAAKRGIPADKVGKSIPDTIDFL
jgi:hypothetical protein